MDNSNNNSFSDDYGRPTPPRSRLKAGLGLLVEIIKIAVISLVIIVPVRYFLIQPFYVKGASMEPSFYDHEYLIIDEITYRFSEPKRGDIVVFKYPKDPRQYFIKRIVGLPGEQIKIDNGKVQITGRDGQSKLLAESYLPEDLQTELPLKGYSNVLLGDEEYFLLGDNRDESLDSRIFGPVKRDFIIGRTWLRGWPFSRLTVFSAPAYNQ